MRSEKACAIITWSGLGGYALMAPASIAISQILFGLALLGFVGYLLTQKNRKDPVLPPIVIMVVIFFYVSYRFFTMVIAQTDLLIIKEDWLFLMVIVGAVMFRNIRNLTRVLDVFAFGVLVMGSYGIWQHFVGVDLYHQVLLDRMTYGYRVIGNFSTYLTYSGFFAVASILLIPIAFKATSRARKLYYLLASQVGLISLLFNYSRSTIVALIAGAIVLLILIGARYRAWVSLVILLTLAVGIVVSPDFMSRFKNMQTEFSSGYANSRWAIWGTALSIIRDNPLYGVGPGNFRQEYINHRQNRTGRDLSHAHNDILNSAAESGLPAAGFYLLMWLLFLLYLYKGYRQCPDGFQKGLILGSLVASIVFLVMSQFEASFADEEVRLLLMFVWAIGLAVLGNLKASERLSEIA
jgi:O-antigen ligase